MTHRESRGASSIDNRESASSHDHCPHCQRLQSLSKKISPPWEGRQGGSGRSGAGEGRFDDPHLSTSGGSSITNRRRSDSLETSISLGSGSSSTIHSHASASHSSSPRHHPHHRQHQKEQHSHDQHSSARQHHGYESPSRRSPALSSSSSSRHHHHHNHHHSPPSSPHYRHHHHPPSPAKQHRPSRLEFRFRRRKTLFDYAPVPIAGIIQQKPWILSRDSPLKRGWDTLTLCLAIVFLWHGTLEATKRINNLLYLEIIWFACDIFLTFRTEVVIPGSDGTLTLKDPKEIAERYLAQGFWIDLAFSIPWMAIFGLVFAPRPKKSGAIRRFFVKIGRGTWGGIIKAKNAMGSKVPRALRLSSIRRFLRITEIMEVKKVEGVKHIVKYRSGYQILLCTIRGLRRVLRSHVLAFSRRFYNKLIPHLASLVKLEDGSLSTPKSTLSAMSPVTYYQRSESSSNGSTTIEEVDDNEEDEGDVVDPPSFEEQEPQQAAARRGTEEVKS